MHAMRPKNEKSMPTAACKFGRCDNSAWFSQRSLGAIANNMPTSVGSHHADSRRQQATRSLDSSEKPRSVLLR